MENILLDDINELNSNIRKIKKNKSIKWKNTIFLPTLQYLETNNNTTTKLEEILNEKQNVKKLKFYKIGDFNKASDNMKTIYPH